MVCAKRFAVLSLLVPGPSSPSGHSNCYASVPYRFPTAIQLQGLEVISDALVGRVRWDNPTVIEELDILFGPHEKKAQQFISDWRLKATQIALDTIVKSYQIEKRAFVSAVAFAQAINKELKTILANMSKETPSVNDKSDLTALNSKVVKALQQTSGILKEIQEIQRSLHCSLI
ncbi:hypothetical protein CISG_10321 [Coccidioides immitis RMSCC 3703]|uniref:Uncharacterized protein n=1 Tax=Coccidioides immitis RMSCC 3703 TaxID=454286 RepID=A0A0J8QP05_COCIT|nr:hypothetical protein CISG_10321 [Coccidioides immitis RMSCC 3703]